MPIKYHFDLFYEPIDMEPLKSIAKKNSNLRVKKVKVMVTYEVSGEKLSLEKCLKKHLPIRMKDNKKFKFLNWKRGQKIKI